MSIRIYTATAFALLALCVVGALSFLPSVSESAGSSVCYFDGCVVFDETGDWIDNFEKFSSAASLMDAILEAALSHTTAETQYDENGLLTYVACANGVVAHAYYGVPPGCVPNTGASCQSAPNVCGTKNTGTIGCNGGCSAPPPSDSECPAGSCPDGYPPVNGACVARCPGGALPVNGVCGGTGCPPNFIMQNGACIPTSGGGGGPGGGGPGENGVCPIGYILSESRCVFSACPTGYVQHGDRCDFVGCPDGYVRNGAQCIRGCTPQYFCSGKSIMYRNSSCTDTTVKACSYECRAGECVAPPSATISITATPGLVRQGQTTRIVWSARYVESCSVTGTNGDAWSGTSGDTASGIIETQTTFTLNCIDLEGRAVSASANVSVSPIFQER